MAIRLRIDCDVKLSQDSQGKKLVYDRNLDTPEITEAFAHGNSRDITVPKGAGGLPNEVAVNLAGLAAASFLYIESDKAITVKLNDVALPVLTPRAGVAAEEVLPGRVLLMAAGINTIALSNASQADDAVVTVVLGG